MFEIGERDRNNVSLFPIRTQLYRLDISAYKVFVAAPLPGSAKSPTIFSELKNPEAEHLWAYFSKSMN